MSGKALERFEPRVSLHRGGAEGNGRPGGEGAGGVVDPRLYLRTARHHWRLAAAVFATVVAGVAAGTLLQSPVYRATGMLELRPETAEAASVEALLQPARAPGRYLETQYGILRSPALAERVLADLRARRVEPARVAALTPRELQDALAVNPVTGSNLVRVSFESPSPRLAAAVVNAVFDGYLALRVEAGRAAEARLAHEVDSVRAELTEAERRLQEYARANGLVVLDDGAGQTENMANERLRRLQQQLTDAEEDRYRKEAAYNLAQRQGGAFLDSEALQALSVRIADLSAEYARLRSTFTESYPRAREVKRQLDELEALRSGERRRAAEELRNAYLAAVRHEGMVRGSFEEQKRLVDQLAARSADYGLLRRDVESHRQLYDVLQQKQKAAGVSAALAATEVNVVDRAAPPESPVRPSLPLNLALAVVLGLVLGLAAAFLRELMRPLVRGADEVASLAGVQLLGMIPAAEPAVANGRSVWRALRPGRPDRRRPLALAADAGRDWPRIDRHDPQQSALVEAFGGLRTSVLWDTEAGQARSILVTSSQPREGKTTVSVNLAISLGRLGKRVLLVDGDVRRPSVHRAFGVASGPGLVEYLGGRADWRRLVHREAAPGVDLLKAGRVPQNPTELLSTDRMRLLVSEAEAEYDFVVLDSAALLVNAADARVLAALVHGVVLVVRSGVTPREVLTRVTRLAPNLLGVVLNGLDARSLPSYYTTYSAVEAEAAETGVGAAAG